MIRIYPVWLTKEGIGKEREASVGSQDLFAQIDFIGEHYLPIEDIPHRVMGMEEDEYGVVREKDSLHIRVYGLDPYFALMRGKEKVIENQRATSIFRALNRPGISGGDFLDINKFGENLARYAASISGQKMKPRDIPGFNELKQEFRKYQKFMAQKLKRR